MAQNGTGPTVIMELVEALKAGENKQLRTLMANELWTFLSARDALQPGRPFSERDMLQLLARFQWIADLARLPEGAPTEDSFVPPPASEQRRFPDLMRDRASESTNRPRIDRVIEDIAGTGARPRPTHVASAQGGPAPAHGQG